MLVVLPHGIAVDPEIVKYVTIRPERPQGPKGPIIFSVVMKTDADEHLQVLGAYDKREEAQALSGECAKRINKALGADDDGGDDDW